MGPMDIGIFLAVEPHQRSAADDMGALVDLAQAAEELGYRSLWLASRHFSPRYAAIASPLVLLAAAAARTRRIELGTAVVTLPLENMLRLAEDFATLDAVTGGRGRLGVGSGDDPPAFKAMGVDYQSRAGLNTALFPRLLELLSGADLGEGVKLYPEVADPLSKVALAAQSARGAAWAASKGVALLQGRTEPNSFDPTVSQVRAAEAYRAVYPEGRIMTTRNAWVGSAQDPTLVESLVRLGANLRARGADWVPEDPRALVDRMQITAGEPHALATNLRARVASIAPDELLITPDPGGLDSSDRLKRMTMLAEGFALLGPADA
jgi:alkanesulfonate monooxygenase SsuD/methylene tetrahydromethanopterin reductase-like flavin-dependent oxidoreductase (luciferase family)